MSLPSPCGLRLAGQQFDVREPGGPIIAFPVLAGLQACIAVARKKDHFVAAIAAEREAIARVLQQTRWNRKKTAQILRVSYKTLLTKIKETGLDEN